MIVYATKVKIHSYVKCPETRGTKSLMLCLACPKFLDTEGDYVICKRGEKHE